MDRLGAGDRRAKRREPRAEQGAQIDGLQIPAPKRDAGEIGKLALAARIELRPPVSIILEGVFSLLKHRWIDILEYEMLAAVRRCADHAVRNDADDPDAALGVECEPIREGARTILREGLAWAKRTVRFDRKT